MDSTDFTAPLKFNVTKNSSLAYLHHHNCRHQRIRIGTRTKDARIATEENIKQREVTGPQLLQIVSNEENGNEAQSSSGESKNSSLAARLAGSSESQKPVKSSHHEEDGVKVHHQVNYHFRMAVDFHSFLLHY